MFYTVCYDIPDDRRRLRVMKTLKDYGTRVQYSVFEATLGPDELERLQHRLKRILDEKEDSVRFYPLCMTCAGQIGILGQGVVTEDPEIIVI